MSFPLSSSFLTISLLIVTTFAGYNAADYQLPGFTYNGGNGPNKWGNLSPNFSACSHGKMQSPINIVRNKASPDKSLKPLHRHYHPVNASLVDYGFDVAIKFEGDAGGFNLDGKHYSLVNMHWHSPSEHRLDGKLCAAELHMVHKTYDNRSFSVVAVLYKYGAADPLLAKVQSRLVELAKEKSARSGPPQIELGTLDTMQLKKRFRRYYRYTGSFTTPPCWENVTWNILGKVRSISKEQVEELKAPLTSTCKNNSRPCQLLHGRKVMLYDSHRR